MLSVIVVFVIACIANFAWATSINYKRTKREEQMKYKTDALVNAARTDGQKLSQSETLTRGAQSADNIRDSIATPLYHASYLNNLGSGKEGISSNDCSSETTANSYNSHDSSNTSYSNSGCSDIGGGSSGDSGGGGF